MERKFKPKKCMYCEQLYIPKSSKQLACKLRHDLPCPSCGEIQKNRENRSVLNKCKKCAKVSDTIYTENKFLKVTEEIKENTVKHRIYKFKCPTCNLRYDTENKKQIYCKRNLTNTCEVCFKVYNVNLCRYSDSRTCSHDCQRKLKKSKVEVNCITCNAIIEAGNTNRKFCWDKTLNLNCISCKRNFEVIHACVKGIKATDELECFSCKQRRITLENREKIRATNLKRYNVPYTTQAIEVIHKINKSKNIVASINYDDLEHQEDWFNIKEVISNNPNQTLEYWSNYFNLSPRSVAGKISKNQLSRLVKDFYKFSQKERDFYKFLIEDLKLIENEDFIFKSKNIISKELDFYFPKHNLAVEISPTFTHQYYNSKLKRGVKDKDYHFNKFKECYLKEIELITIFDWTDNSNIKNFIKDKIQNNDEVIYARNTTINISTKVLPIHREFLKENHILGPINNRKDSFVVELIYNNCMVGLGIFYPTSNISQFELKRLAFKDNIKVIGGASRILKNAFKYNPNILSIITFSDNNLGTGNVYQKIGFSLIKEETNSLIWSNPKLDKYVKNTSLVLQGADRLLKNIPNYTPYGIGENLPTNQEIVQEHGFVPVYDCGYRKWVFYKK